MPTLYTAQGGSNSSNLYTVNPATGAVTIVGPTGRGFTGLAFDPTSGILYGSTSTQSPLNPRSLVTVNPATGTTTLVGAYGLGLTVTMADIAFDSAGQLYGYSSSGRKLYKVDKSSGAPTLMGTSSSHGAFGQGIEIDDANLGYLFPNGAGDGSAFYEMDLSNAAITTIALTSGWTPGGDPSIGACSFGPDQAMWFITTNFGAPGTLATITSAGVITVIGDTTGVVNTDALAWDGGVKPAEWNFIPPPPATDTLFAARGGVATTSDLYTVDPATAVMTSIGPIGFAVTGLAEDPTDGTLYGITSNNSAVSPLSLITIDKVTGAGSLVGAESPGTNTPWTDIAFDMYGNLYAFAQSTRFYSVNKATGVGTLLGGVGGATSGGAISIRSRNVGYAAPNGIIPAGNRLYTFSTTGTFTAGPFFSGGPGGRSGAFAFDQTDDLYAVGGVGGTTLITIDTTTAAITTIGLFTFDQVDGLTWGTASTATDDFSVALTPNALSICPGFSDTTALSTTITIGVAQSITLSDTGAPAGVSLAYATNPIMSGAGTTVTVTVGGGVAPGVYPIVIHADGTSTSHTTTLTLTVAGPVNDAYGAFEGHTLTVAAPGVMTNDIGPTTVSLNTGVSHGTLTLNADGSFTYTPDIGYRGSDSFTYNGHCGTATVTLTITGRDPTGVFSGDVGFRTWSMP